MFAKRLTAVLLALLLALPLAGCREMLYDILDDITVPADVTTAPTTRISDAPAPTPTPPEASATPDTADATATPEPDATPDDPTPRPIPEDAHFVKSVYDGYYLSGWMLPYDGGVIFADAPGGTGGGPVNAYIQPDGKPAALLTPYMDGFSPAYLFDDWLFFSYVDEDKGVYNFCRMNIHTLDEPEFLPPDIIRLFASHEFLLYFKDDIDNTLYRNNVMMNDEQVIFESVPDIWNVKVAKYNLLYLSEDPYEAETNSVFVYDMVGNLLYTISMDVPTSWGFYWGDEAFYWCERNDKLKQPVRVHMVDLINGSEKTVQVRFTGARGTFTGVVDADEDWLYLMTFDDSSPFDDDTEFYDNVYLYRAPRDGGNAEFVRSWYES